MCVWAAFVSRASRENAQEAKERAYLLACQLERPRPSWSDVGVPTPAGGRWHATQVIRVRERLGAAT